MNRSIGLALCLVPALGGCQKLAPQRVPDRGAIQRLGIPYPVGEPVKEQSGPRLRLASSKFMLVRPGTEPLLVARVLIDDETGFASLYERAFGRTPYDGHDRVLVDADALVEAGIESPGDSVLVVGPDGPCRAGLGAPGVELHAGEPRHLEIAWSLTGCDGGTVAPVAILTDRLADAVGWRAAELSVDTMLGPDRTWKDPLADATMLPSWNDQVPAEVAAVQVWWIPGVEPSVVQVYRGLMQPAPEPSDACGHREAWMQTNGWWNGQWLDPIEPGDDPSVAPQLRGALVHDTQIDAIVYEQRGAPLVLVPPATAADGTTSPWAVTLVDPGLVAPAASVQWGWSMIDREVAWRPFCG